MPPVTTTGKAGTIKAEEFSALTALVAAYGPEVVIQKVGKICMKKADSLMHEYPSSAVGAAYKSLAAKIKATFVAASASSSSSR